MTETPDETAPVLLDLETIDLEGDAERGATMPVVNPRTGARTGATVTLLGQEAATYRGNLRKLRDAAAAYPEREPTDEDTRMLLARARQAGAAITGWTGIGFGGRAVEFSREAAVELCFKRPWLADQILAFITAPGNFARG
ncbi:hypothetical protein [Methylobacterium nodulans]|uniref:Uncharacterized protein n=1 Tax=Methylobacterium nodulans (strain LMG 21967 / CNCM I-2342 / ORS 2060) TaxID=460265 RepID=B8IAJ3_METNO|nr:hypothetical protein [Methylobacterium nodulans]ACL61038.1 conserved hypothetical protein [Methylobacterium nodulans ORS 2060]